jgi:hypothetical protein
MRGTLRHNIDPAVGHPDGAAPEIHVECAGESADVRSEFFLEAGERAGKAVELVHRSVAGVAAGVILGGPLAAGGVELSQFTAFVGELGVQARERGGRFLERLAVDERGKMGAGRHGRKREVKGRKSGRQP